MNSNYQTQDRGEKTDYLRYLEAMDAVSIEKVASASTFFEPEKGNTIVDVGMASGTSSAILARLFPDLQIVGVDINPKMVQIARQSYQLPNLSFRVDDGEKLVSFEKNSVNGFFNCSSIHHITSFNNYQNHHALRTLERQVGLLKEGGIIVIRDFVKPDEKEVILALSTQERNDRPIDPDLLIEFSRSARSLASPNERGFPLKEIPSKEKNIRRFRLFYTDAVEFIRRKDYFNNWDIELQEEYGYYTQQEFENIFRELGLRIILSGPIYNQWIISNRYRGQLGLFTPNGEELGLPPTNFLIAGEKTYKGKHIDLIRHLPPTEQPFLRFTSYKHLENDQIFDVVERPNEVLDIVPYYIEGDRIFVMVKQSYPRPLINVSTDSPLLDDKHFSGYISEGLTIGKTVDSHAMINRRFQLSADQYTIDNISLKYYTSPGGINEKVSSSFLKLHALPKKVTLLEAGYSGFKESGSIQLHDASQLLNTAQTGALAEARLELNIYHLFYQNKWTLPPWLGQKINVPEEKEVSPTPLSDILSRKKQAYSKTNEKAGFLRTERGYFSESGVEDSHSILEYIYPEHVSCNTLITLPLARWRNKIYIGLELRDLPVPQIHDGNSTLLTAPAKRLPKAVSSMHELEQYISTMRIGNSRIKEFFKLGEKFYPSIGITPERVYPYVVNLDKPTEELYWVSLDNLFTSFEKLQDAHLLICLARLRHALKY